MNIPSPFINVDMCFRFVQNWDTEAKKELIIRIVQSLPQSGIRDVSVIDAALSKSATERGTKPEVCPIAHSFLPKDFLKMLWGFIRKKSAVSAPFGMCCVRSDFAASRRTDEAVPSGGEPRANASKYVL
jgi:hypothetical protein